MEQTYHDGDTVIVQRWCVHLRKNDVIVCAHPQRGRLLLKRIQDSRSHPQGAYQYFVMGDNALRSTDSRHFGWLEKKYILGKVIYKT